MRPHWLLAQLHFPVFLRLIDQYSQQVDAMNQRVYNRALSVLTQPQLEAFSTFQKNMATAQVAGIKMAKQMFKGSGQ
jgi:hypothetical protein